MKKSLWYFLAESWRGATFVLPTLLILYVTEWLSKIITAASRADLLAHVIAKAAGLPSFFEWLLAVLLVALGCFVLGMLFDKTAWGRCVYQAYEHRFKKIIPFYEAVTNIIKILREGKAVVLVKAEYRGSRSLGVITRENATHAAVFIPTSPLPGTGWTAFFKKSELIYTPLTVWRFLWIVATCGVDSDEVLELCAKYDAVA